MRSYRQAEPPGPVTCAVYLLVLVFILGTVIFIGIKVWMEH